jgi:hypothetical protein
MLKNMFRGLYMEGKVQLVCEAGPSVGLIPVKLMAARALLSIKMHAIFIYFYFHMISN